jgi:hypothetical protein
VLLGGNQLRTVDFDSGRTTASPRAMLRPGEYVIGLAAASQTYAAVTRCDAASARVLRIGTDGKISNIALCGSVGTVFADGAHAWGFSYPNDNSSSGYLVPLNGGGRVRLPSGIFANLITDGVVVGNTGSPTGIGSLLLIDAATGHVRNNLGSGVPVAVGNGIIFWMVGCDPSNYKPCTLHRRSVAGGTTSSYRLPGPPCCGALSPDGRLVAFTIERAAQDPRYALGHPFPPSDIAILDLDTARLEIVPGIENPPKVFPGLAFSTDSRWLLIAIDAGPETRLLAWRSGLPHPSESKPISGLALAPAPIVVLPSHTAR